MEDGQHLLGQCLLEMHGVWGWDNDKPQGIALKESYFKKHPEIGKAGILFLATLL